MDQIITQPLFDSALTFQQYLDLTKSIVESKAPEGPYGNPSTHRYTKSNLERMHKALDNTVISQRLYNQLSDLNEDWIWLIISEPWCGDASWGVPALYLIANCSDRIDFRIILRDQHPDIMRNYQTGGSDSVPKMICLRKSGLAEIGTWGPRPAVLHEMVLKWKNEPGSDYRESVRQLHAWFDADMSRSIDSELSILVKAWKEINKTNT